LLSILSSLGFIKQQGRRKMAEPWDSIKIVNVVASTSIGQEMNLKQLTLDLDGADYDPERFPGLVYRTSNPKTAALLFRSGKIICTGAKSIAEVHKSVENIFQSLRNVGIDVKGTSEIKVQNVVSSADLHAVLNLDAIAIGLGLENIEYEPEQFPGLVYRLSEPRVVVLIFGSGKLVITGGRKPEDAVNAVDRIVKDLKSLSFL
jgi:transcription initiation factor TFIID TATA-box-binding protein